MKIHNLAFLLLFQSLACKQAPESSSFSSLLPFRQQVKQAAQAPTATIVLRSGDGGQTWQNISEGLPEPAKDEPRAGRNVSFADESGLYLADGNGLYHSNPNATAPFWTRQFIPDERGSITPGKAGILTYDSDGHFLQKKEGANKWSPVYRNCQQKRVRSLVESAAGSIFIGSDDGLFKSVNSGKTWRRVYTGGGVFNLVASNGVLMAVSGIGIIRSIDDGENWEFVINQERRGFLVESINGGFAISLDNTAVDKRSVQASFDGGQSWQPIDGDLPASSFIASIVQVGDNFFCSHPAGIFKSSDKGKSWKLLLPSIDDKVFKLYVSGDVIYALPRNRGC